MGTPLIEVKAPDGRQIAAAQWGDPSGIPVFSLHGTPGSRLGRHPYEDRVAALGARMITYDRPGYGASDRNRGRRVVDCVADVEAIADSLGIQTFAVTGGSGGGPHALAVGARLPERVTRCRCLVGSAPYGAAGLDWLQGMDPLNIKEFHWALAGEDTLRAELEREAATDLARMAHDPTKVLSDEWQVSAADRAVLGRPEVQAVMGEQIREAFANGVWGWVDDDLALTTPWGFDVVEIRVPVEIRYGAQDVMVPAAHGAWLAEHVPNAQVYVSSESGHLSDPEETLRMLPWLLEGAA
jgi:pimeloyl-ACP methyl ester carboxylesterase